MNQSTIIPYEYAKRYQLLSKEQTPQNVLIWHTDQTPLSHWLEIQRFFMPRQVRFEKVSYSKWQQALQQQYQKSPENLASCLQDSQALMNDLPLNEQHRLLEQDSHAPVIRLINQLLSQAVKEGASDVHLQTQKNELIARFRIDGCLKEVMRTQNALAPFVASRIKVMAQLNIAETRRPQDGRMTVQCGDQAVDVRVSVLPARHGERVVLRLLNQHHQSLALAELGFSQPVLTQLQGLIKKPHGIILLTGPTGSGKTTSLYALLSAINDGEKNILTIEDPIEYDLSGIGQTQVQPQVDLTFAKGLRAILRQDPDVVMVGEIRDQETAQIAVQASLTGHLVLSTLHTNTAVGAVTRLRDLGIEPYLLASSVLAVVAQRLVRVLCPECRQPRTLSTHEQPSWLASMQHYTAQGCSQCLGRGYRGRTVLSECLVLDDTARELIHANASEAELSQHLAGVDLKQHAAQKIQAGTTSLAEALAVLSYD